MAIENKINRRKWQAAPLIGWDVVCVFSNKRILVTGAGAGKGFSVLQKHEKTLGFGFSLHFCQFCKGERNYVSPILKTRKWRNVVLNGSWARLDGISVASVPVLTPCI